MRFTPAAMSLAAILFVSSSISVGQKPQPIDARSQSWVERGRQALAAKNYGLASDAFETALAIDPRNGAAFLGLAGVARAQGLPGKAIHFFDQALQLDPRDTDALEGQGLAMLDKGALTTARGNLAKLQAACKAPCKSADTLAAAISSAAQPRRLVAKGEAKDQPTSNE